MKKLEARLSRTGQAIKGTAADLGSWDVSLGLKRTIYLHNPNDYAKANLSKLGNKDGRVKLNMPNEIAPGATERIEVIIQPQVFETEIEERNFFKDALDELSGTVIWEKP